MATQSDFTATITWGNNTISTGVVAPIPNSPPGSFSVAGTTSYATAGTYTITIVVQDNMGDSTTIVSTADVANPVLTPVPTTVNLSTGVIPSPSPTIGSFFDTDTSAGQGNFTASINWGDGNSSIGTVTGSAGSFAVSGTNLYAAPGTYNITITVQDNLGDMTTIDSKAVVASPVLTPIPTTVNFSTGVAPSPSPTIGSFLDSDISAPATSFTASIDWGDGNKSAGTVTTTTPASGVYAVTGTNLYAAPGTYNIVILVTDSFGDTATIDSKVIVASPVLTPIPTTVNFSTGVAPSPSPTIGSFLDSDTSAPATSFTASINWGDGNKSAGTVTTTTPTGVYAVTGTNLYGAPGTYNIVILVTDSFGDTVTIDSKVIVASPVLTAIPTTVNFSTGVAPSPSPTIGSFLDSDTSAPATSFTASINWGDGNKSAGTVTTTTPTGVYAVTGTNLYGAPGTYDIVILVTDSFGDTVTIDSKVIVASPVLTAIPTTVNFSTGVVPSPSPTIGSFLDSDTSASATSFTASINWGDGNKSAGTVTTTAGSGLYAVTGANLYAAPGTYNIVILVTDSFGDTVTIDSKVIVASPVLTPIPTTVNFSTGVVPSPSPTIGAFLDSDTSASATSFTASINWGDGNKSAGTVTTTAGSGLYAVTGANLYAAPGTYNIVILVTDSFGDTVTIDSKAIVAGPVLTPVPATASFTVGVPPISPVLVGSFYDSSPSVTASQFTATINWGPGQQTSPATVVASPSTSGLFLVQGSYLYSAPGTYPLTIAIQDDQGNSLTINSTAVVVTNVVTTPADFGFSGGLDPNSDNGPFADAGYTNTNRPTFSGTAVPFSVVQLYARYWARMPRNRSAKQ